MLILTHGAYSGTTEEFNAWRRWIARCAGYAIRELGPNKILLIDLEWHLISEANIAGRWDAAPADPLLVLLAHSAAAGMIDLAQAGPLADALERIVDASAKAREGRMSRRDARRLLHNEAITLQFIAGLRAAVQAGEGIAFIDMETA